MTKTWGIVATLTGIIVLVAQQFTPTLPAEANPIPDPLVTLPESNTPAEPLPDLPSYKVSAGPQRAAAAKARVQESLTRDLTEKNLHWGDPVFLRALKEEGELEVYILSRTTKRYEHFRSYPIAKQSGTSGPKLAEGDGQVPEGFYYADRSALKSDSAFHLAINCGYPNTYDRANGRTGSFIMIHGNCVSVGCLAMTDAKIEEIYSLCDAALQQGQPFIRIHFFPFRMTAEQMEKHQNEPWHSFWLNLQEGYEFFEKNGVPPNVTVENKRYVFSDK